MVSLALVAPRKMAGSVRPSTVLTRISSIRSFAPDLRVGRGRDDMMRKSVGLTEDED
jgi:hypothetical protein